MKRIYGMLHLADMAGDRVERAIAEARIYAKHDLRGCIVENYHGSKHDVENVLIKLSELDLKCSNGSDFEIGINILPNEYREAFELASKYNASFIQLDHVAGRYRSQNKIVELDHENYSSVRSQHPNIKVMGGVWPKYYSPLIKDTDTLVSDTSDGKAIGKQFVMDLKTAINNAEMIVVTGKGTGISVSMDKVVKFRHDMNRIAAAGYDLKRELIIGSGMNAENVETLFYADGAIVGSCFKPDNDTFEMVSETRVEEFMQALKNCKLLYK